jgi:hypothetical protein
MKAIRRLLILATFGLCGVFLVPATTHAWPGTASIGVEAGLPLVTGFQANYHVRPNWQLGLEFGRVSGLTALGAEARWLIRGESHGFVPSIVAGAEQYFLEDGGRDATPVGLHLALGLDYYLDAPISFGVELGGMTTFGSSNGDQVKVFSIGNDVSKAMFNVGARYHF